MEAVCDGRSVAVFNKKEVFCDEQIALPPFSGYCVGG
jgi:hypothetical protein